jgi:glycerol uptake facilitator protein
MESPTLLRRSAAEFLGTAFLVIVGVGSVPALAIARGEGPFTGADLGFIALAFATIVIVTAHVFGPVSGNHINPAVTLALALTRRFAWRDVPVYIAAQLAGGLLGAVVIVGVLGTAAAELGLGISSYGESTPWYQAFFAEFFGTFLLVVAVFGAIHHRSAAGWGGLVIGLAVFAAIIAVGPITGASINPARNTGPMLVQQFLGGEVSWEQVPVYVIAEVLGAVMAAVGYTWIAGRGDDAPQRSTATSRD